MLVNRMARSYEEYNNVLKLPILVPKNMRSKSKQKPRLAHHTKPKEIGFGIKKNMNMNVKYRYGDNEKNSCSGIKLPNIKSFDQVNMYITRVSFDKLNFDNESSYFPKNKKKKKKKKKSKNKIHKTIKNLKKRKKKRKDSFSRSLITNITRCKKPILYHHLYTEKSNGRILFVEILKFLPRKSLYQLCHLSKFLFSRIYVHNHLWEFLYDMKFRRGKKKKLGLRIYTHGWFFIAFKKSLKSKWILAVKNGTIEQHFSNQNGSVTCLNVNGKGIRKRKRDIKERRKRKRKGKKFKVPMLDFSSLKEYQSSSSESESSSDDEDDDEE